MYRNSPLGIFIPLTTGILIFVVLACNASRQATDSGGSTQLKTMDPYIGIWDYAVRDSPEGDMPGELEILVNKGDYSATMRGANGKIDVENFPAFIVVDDKDFLFFNQSHRMIVCSKIII